MKDGEISEHPAMASVELPFSGELARAKAHPLTA
jgi:hypothetical protein